MIAIGGWAGTPLSGSPFQESFLHRMCGMVNAFVTQTYKHFQFIEDPRVNRGANYPLMELIFVTLCAVICDADSWTDVERYGKAKQDWLRKFFPFASGIPSHDTLGRVFAKLDSVAFFSALQSLAADLGKAIKNQNDDEDPELSAPNKIDPIFVANTDTEWLLPEDDNEEEDMMMDDDEEKEG